MDTAEWEAELNLLLNEMQNQPEDRYEFFLQLREKLAEIRAVGMPVPDDLARFEKELEEEFARERKRPGQK